MPLLTAPTLHRGSRLCHGVLRSHAGFIDSETWHGRHSRYAIERIGRVSTLSLPLATALRLYARLRGAMSGRRHLPSVTLVRQDGEPGV